MVQKLVLEFSRALWLNCAVQTTAAPSIFDSYCFFISSRSIAILSTANMGKRKAKQRKPDTPSKNESKDEPKEAAKEESLPHTSIQAPSPPFTETASNQRVMPCGCPDENAPAKQVVFETAANRALPLGQHSDPSMDSATVCRLPPAFGIYGTGSDLFIRLSRKEATMFFLSLEYDKYDPLACVTLSRYKNKAVGPGTAERGPLATATTPKPPHEKTLDADIRLYDPESPAKGNDKLPVLHEKAETRVSTSNINFNYQVPGYEAKERFVWSYDRGPEIRSLKGGKSGLKLVRYKTGAVVGAWTGPRSALSDTKQGKMAFFDRSLGAQFEFLAIMSLIAYKATQQQRVYMSAARTYGPESQYWSYGSSAYNHPGYGHSGYKHSGNGIGRFGNTGCLGSRDGLLGFGNSACPDGHHINSSFGNPGSLLGGSSLFRNSGYSYGNSGYYGLSGYSGPGYGYSSYRRY